MTSQAEELFSFVLELRPRVAVFDCDGTLWDCDSGEGFFYWEMERGLLPRAVVDWAKPRYQEYRDGRVDEERMCGEMVTIHEGLEQAALDRAAEEYFATQVVPGIFTEMRELTRLLANEGCQVWAVSSTNDWVVRAGAARFGIPAERVLAAKVHVENSFATSRLVRVPTDEGKARAVREVIGAVPDVAFGNSMHDAALLEMARQAVAVNPNPDLERMAREKGWRVYFPAKPR